MRAHPSRGNADIPLRCARFASSIQYIRARKDICWMATALSDCDRVMEMDQCTLEMTRLYKEIQQLDNSKKCIEDRLTDALCRLHKCRLRHLLLADTQTAPLRRRERYWDPSLASPSMKRIRDINVQCVFRLYRHIWSRFAEFYAQHARDNDTHWFWNVPVLHASVRFIQ